MENCMGRILRYKARCPSAVDKVLAHSTPCLALVTRPGSLCIDGIDLSYLSHSIREVCVYPECTLCCVEFIGHFPLLCLEVSKPICIIVFLVINLHVSDPDFFIIKIFPHVNLVTRICFQ